jgi:transglutaminase-like putative cysteine protease
MHALVNVPLPAHDEKTDAVLLYSEATVSVLPDHKIKTRVREAYKILRPTGRGYGAVEVSFHPGKKVASLHGWCIPAQGKDYEVKDKDAVESALPEIVGSELVSDVKDKLLRIPAPDPGNVVGYEYEVEEQPLVLQDEWEFQGRSPVREGHYSLQLPPGWEFKASWLNYPEVKPTQAGDNQWQWVVSDVKAIREEEDMPPLSGVAGQMIVTFFPPGGAAADVFATWREMGNWYQNLTSGRRDASAQIKEKVTALTASAATPLQKMRALAQFVQHDIRYVAIELGIGGWQPHPAPEVFVHRYGDCKDIATLLAAMLREIGVDSYDVRINVRRGAVTPATPAHLAFNHAIIAIKLPEGVTEPSLIATMQHPKLGRLLFFDPTNDFTPFGQIGGYLQANYGLLVTPEGGELVEVPKQPSAMNGIQRTAKLTLDAQGTLRGDVEEVRLGDRASFQRRTLTTVTKDSDRIKPIEGLLADSLSTFRITKATVINLQQTGQPLGFNYSFEAQNYAKSAGGLLLVRPRVLGRRSSALLETKEPRKYPVEFDGPELDTDAFDITLPTGYEVDDLPPPVDAEYSFASYHSMTAVHGNVIHYARTFEVKELSVPVSRVEELKRFYRSIAGDERNTAVLRPTMK